jgi:hypothetical protein
MEYVKNRLIIKFVGSAYETKLSIEFTKVTSLSFPWVGILRNILWVQER